MSEIGMNIQNIQEYIDRFDSHKEVTTYDYAAIRFLLAALAEKGEQIATLKNVILSDERQIKNLVKRNEEMRNDLIKTAHDRDIAQQQIAALTAQIAEKEREKDELLTNQRRRMGAEYDDLDAELKRVRIVAAEQIAALTEQLAEKEQQLKEAYLSIAKTCAEKNKQIAALQAELKMERDRNKVCGMVVRENEAQHYRIKELEGVAKRAIGVCVCHATMRHDTPCLSCAAKAALEVKEKPFCSVCGKELEIINGVVSYAYGTLVGKQSFTCNDCVHRSND